MRSLLRSRRGSVAFATVIALIPLIGVVALGGEAGSWYVTRQHAQNAADAAAYSGAVQQLCLTDPNVPCAVAQTVDYRAKQSAAQNAFCNAGDNSYPGSVCSASLPTGVSQTVTITPLTSWNGTAGSFVQATVSQRQPGYLTQVLGLSTVNIPATAVARVKQADKLPCLLASSGPITVQDSSVQITAPNCGLASNGTPIGFDLHSMTTPPRVGAMTTAGGCSGDASLCGKVSTYNPPVIDPFSPLTSAISGLTLTPCGSRLQPYVTIAGDATRPGHCANDNTNINKQTSLTESGVYFFSGGLSLTGSGSLRTCTGTSNDPDPVCTSPAQLAKGQITATIIVLPISGNKTSLKMAGGSSFDIVAPTTAPSAPSGIPSQLASVAKFLKNMALFDPEVSPQTTGTSTMSGSGVFYLPKADPLNWKGSATGQVSTCTEVIAASIKLSGTPQFDNSGCDTSILIVSRIVDLVQ
ncbi:Flp pilus assembly protein TadG [Bradyrhizobium sp. LM2.7]